MQVWIHSRACNEQGLQKASPSKKNVMRTAGAFFILLNTQHVTERVQGKVMDAPLQDAAVALAKAVSTSR